MNRFAADELMSSRTVMLILLGLTIAFLSMNSAHSAWFDRTLLADNTAKDNTYTVKDVDRDEIFVIDDFIYDARQSCYLSVGDQVVFSEGQYGVDYHATIYDLDDREPCELLLRDPVS